MRYKVLVFVLLAVLLTVVFSSCVTMTPTSFYSEISEDAYTRITDQKEFDDGWWQQGEIHFHDGTIWCGEIARYNDTPLVKFRRDTIRKVFNHVQLKVYIYHMEEEDHTFVFKDVSLNPRLKNIEILEVMQHGDITLYRSWFVKSSYDPVSMMPPVYTLVSKLYIQRGEHFIPWKNFDKDVLPLIEPTVYQNYIDIWGKKAANSIKHQLNIIRDHNENKLKNS
jgi:hypothetical protein